MNMMLLIVTNFDYNGPGLVLTINALNVEIYKHLNILSLLEVDFRLIYQKIVFKIPTFAKFQLVVFMYKYNLADVSGKHWDLGDSRNISNK